MQFQELNLSAPLLEAVAQLDFTEMTEIQEKTIPLLLEGKDVIGKSNTGTGKTAAFSIPILEQMQPKDCDHVCALILCPTRELAMQACDEIRKFARFKKHVRPVAVYGGASMDRQIHQLKNGANLVVGTPGRVLDHLRRRTLKLDQLQTIVLDEADEMLNMGFREDIEAVLAQVPEQRQTVLFSATMPPAILAITKQYQKDPVLVQIQSAHRTVDAIAQYYVSVPMGRKTDALQLLLLAKQPNSTMIFCNTKKTVDELTEALCLRGFPAVGLHGDMKQLQRTQVMNGFKSGRSTILIATDVAARGIDVKGVDAVFNYDLPQDHEYYIHRIGRTGRAGKTGTAYNILSGRKQEMELRDISRYTKADITEIAVPTSKELRALAVDSERERLLALSETEVSEEAMALTETLLEQGDSAKHILAAMVQQRLEEATKNLPTFDVPKPIRKGKRAGAKTVRVHINAGRKDRMAPNFILGALVEATGMAGNEFGKIDIHDQFTTVEVPEAELDFVVDAMQNEKINGKQVAVRKYEERDSGYGYRREDSRNRGRNGGQRRSSRHGYTQSPWNGGYNRKRRKG
ncbi:DEAD/DEAH box helicase [uncultured Ruminococcus sp.]|uniref:DEAD/DEAH box helicase n=1 Tax=uncultured Ruminococcus sp. TaxID=165186 RepID=UPI0026368AB8|nr:DEAD/DEAH box helicase [uncultured Ruminococcus sp.]